MILSRSNHQGQKPETEIKAPNETGDAPFWYELTDVEKPQLDLNTRFSCQG